MVGREWGDRNHTLAVRTSTTTLRFSLLSKGRGGVMGDGGGLSVRRTCRKYVAIQQDTHHHYYYQSNRRSRIAPDRQSGLPFSAPLSFLAGSFVFAGCGQSQLLDLDTYARTIYSELAWQARNAEFRSTGRWKGGGRFESH